MQLPLVERAMERWGLCTQRLMWSDSRLERAAGTLLALVAILVVGLFVVLFVVTDAACKKLKRLKNKLTSW